MVQNTEITTAANKCYFFIARCLVTASNSIPFTARVLSDSSSCQLVTANQRQWSFQISGKLLLALTSTVILCSKSHGIHDSLSLSDFIMRLTSFLSLWSPLYNFWVYYKENTTSNSCPVVCIFIVMETYLPSQHLIMMSPWLWLLYSSFRHYVTVLPVSPVKNA